jgi:hypothetical protein
MTFALQFEEVFGIVRQDVCDKPARDKEAD